ncbi:MAG TPA: stage II sporulation protein D [Peptococcaceae bacterium]|nr:stage II sporulation protein D [Peptococcaceae bacterium]
MKGNIKKITAVLLAVIFLVGILPYGLTRFFDRSYKDQKLQVRVEMGNGQIRNIPLEEYLIGVVAAEMPAEFELEALKAQAVAARTYVLKRMSESQSNVYDVDTTEKTQAWRSNRQLFRQWGLISYFKYQKKIAQAVEETKGQVLTFNNKLVDTVYHSSSGRKSTERAGDVWSAETSYLVNVPSGEANPLRFVKQQILDAKTFYTMLGFTDPPAELTANDLMILERTKAGRIKTLAVKNKVFTGTDFRARLQLPSTDFEWRIQSDKIELTVYGKGHAVGMSQYGANDMAQAGKKYNQILGHYYPGTKLEKLY